MFSNGSFFSVRVGKKSMSANEVHQNIEAVLQELNEVLDGKLDCMKIAIEFERHSKNTEGKGSEWPNMPIQYKLDERELELYKKDKKQFDDLLV